MDPAACLESEPVIRFYLILLFCPFTAVPQTADDFSHGGAGTGHVDPFIPNMRPQLIGVQVFQGERRGRLPPPPFHIGTPEVITLNSRKEGFSTMNSEYLPLYFPKKLDS